MLYIIGDNIRKEETKYWTFFILFSLPFPVSQFQATSLNQFYVSWYIRHQNMYHQIVAKNTPTVNISTLPYWYWYVSIRAKIGPDRKKILAPKLWGPKLAPDISKWVIIMLALQQSLNLQSPELAGYGPFSRWLNFNRGRIPTFFELILQIFIDPFD